MRLDEFIAQLEAAGWRSQLDAQHQRITELWRAEYPGAASYLDALEKTRTELAALRAHDGVALAQLGRWCLTESRGNDCSDIDGGSLQEKAIELGLLAYVTVTEPCGEDCVCTDYYAGDEWPHDCLRETSAAMRAEG